MCLTHPEAERNPMILSLFRKNTATDAIYGVYRAIVAQSRQPVFYAEWGVPDTVTGRFDMISLHMALVFRRLRSSEAAKNFSQAVFDLFFKDRESFTRYSGHPAIGPATFERLFGTDPALVKSFPVESLNMIKISCVRPTPSGSREERDLHSGQMFVSLLDVELD